MRTFTKNLIFRWEEFFSVRTNIKSNINIPSKLSGKPRKKYPTE